MELEGDEKEEYVESIRKRLEDEENLIQMVDVRDLDVDERIAVFDIDSGTLLINRFHPFVAHFIDEYEDVKKSLPLELLAMSEVLLEANLHHVGIDASMVDAIMELRDELLRTLGKSTGRRNAFVIAQALNDAATNKKVLEEELVAAFNSMGFEAIHVGGSGKPDGTATAILPVDKKGRPQAYKVSLEAKSKEREGEKVASSSVGISRVARHRDDYECDHAIVVGPDFPASEGTVLKQEIEKDRAQIGRTITAMRIVDLGRLVRLRPLRRIGPLEIRGLMKNCLVADDCKNWVDMIEAKRVQVPRYKDLLEIIWARQKKRSDESVEYGQVAMGLENIGINYAKSKVISICKALEGMAPECIACRRNGTVELTQKPTIVLERIKAETEKYPEDEITGSLLRNV